MPTLRQWGAYLDDTPFRRHRGVALRGMSADSHTRVLGAMTTDNRANEVWKPVLWYEGLYEVSDRGNVRSLDRISPSGACRKGRVLKQSIDKTGYARH